MKHALVILCCCLFATSTWAQPLKIIVHKQARQLELWNGTQLQKTYTIALGHSPTGHKEKRGDGKTPEGKYSICIKNPVSRFYLSLGISYPSGEDARRGLQNRWLTPKEYAAVVQSQRNGKVPPWNTSLGGEIFIHGGGISSDWTLGCIALTNEDMKEIFQKVAVGTVVEITK